MSLTRQDVYQAHPADAAARLAGNLLGSEKVERVFRASKIETCQTARAQNRVNACFLQVKEVRMPKRHWRFVPITGLGKWSVGLIVAMPILIIIGASFTNSLYESTPGGETILADLAARPALAITMLAGMVAGISAFITGLLAVTWQKENALLAFVSTVIGALAIVFLCAEIAFPH